MIFFSKSRIAFFDDRFKGSFDKAGSWPADAVEITQEQYITYSNPPPNGKVLGAGKVGFPSWVDKPAPTADELKSLAEQEKTALMTVAEATIAPLNRAVKLGVASDDESELLAEWEMYTVLLMRVDTAAPVWPIMPPV